jgi:hypothetical protein
MHAARRRVLLNAVEALVQGRRLTLTDLARSWPGALWIHAPLKALDRLLSNRHLGRTVMPLHQAMVPWLLRHAQPVILVDWSDLKHDGRWCLLRAAVPMGGRALTLYERIYPLRQMNLPQAQIDFLGHLQQLIPASVTPILVTDAGFRSDWYRAVMACGWDYLGRLRNNTAVRSAGTTAWQPCATLHPLANVSARELGSYEIVKGRPLSCRLVLARRPRRHRDRLTRRGSPEQGGCAKKARKRAREPWLLATSLPVTQRTAARITAAYAQRMQIEEAFRDLKSHRYGMGFEDSLTRRAERLTILLMLHTLAMLAAWLMARAAEPSLSRDPLTRQSAHRSRYSRIRRGLEWLRRRGLPPDLGMAIRRLDPRNNLAIATEQNS